MYIKINDLRFKEFTVWPFGNTVHYFLFGQKIFDLKYITLILPEGNKNYEDELKENFQTSFPFRIENNLTKSLKKTRSLLLTANKKFRIDFLIHEILKNKKYIDYIIDMCDYDIDDKYSLRKNIESLGIMYIDLSREKFTFNKLSKNKKIIQTLNKPIVFIIGDNENTNKFETQLLLRIFFENLEYKISQIGSKPYSEIFGMHSFPSFMLTNTLSESEKIYAFNHYIKQIEIEEYPDIIFVGIPGAFISFNNEYNRGFGVLHFEVFSSITPDVLVLNLLFDEYQENDFLEFENILKYRFGTELDFINISNTKVDWSKTIEQHELSSFKLDKKKVGEHLNESNRKLYYCVDKKSQKKLCEDVLHKLSDYAKVTSI